jgi:hypothetical protein
MRELFPYITASKPPLRSTKPLVQLVKAVEREADHSTPSTAEVQNSSQYIQMPCCLIKHKRQFYRCLVLTVFAVYYSPIKVDKKSINSQSSIVFAIGRPFHYAWQ